MTTPISALPPTQPAPTETVIVVSGLPRSGTSLMMQMLRGGGLAVLTDGTRQADGDNPRGYYEFERVKKLEQGDIAWLADAHGKAVKVITALLEYLPGQYQYKVILMNRQIDEVLASQNKLLVHRGERAGPVREDKLAQMFSRHLAKVVAWLTSQPNIAVLNVDYNRIMEQPLLEAELVNQFLGGHLDVAGMASVVEPALYRNRTP